MRRIVYLFLLAGAVPGAAQAQVAAGAQPAQPRDWERRWMPPPVAPIFVSPMGEPFREGAREAGLERWFAGADKDGDGALTLAEMKGDGARFYAGLDVDGDGEIAPAEINRYESQVAPEIQLGGRMGGPGMRRMVWRRIGSGPGREEGGGRRTGDDADQAGLQGAGLLGLLNIPEPVMDADSDLNRGVSREEFDSAAGQRFLLLDSDHDGRLGLAELKAQLPVVRVPRKGKRRHGPPPPRG
jgi:Ca2+-binding EF-hand superfamily protein